VTPAEQHHYDFHSRTVPMNECSLPECIKASKPVTKMEFEVIQLAAPLTGHGFVRFVNVRPDKANGTWVCDTCTQVITKSKQSSHARSHS
jgi:hypothetical protein